MPRRHLILVALALGTLACRRDRAAVTPADSTFIATMVELRRLPAGIPGDSAVRGAVLRKHGLTRDSLERIARRLAQTPEHAAAVWREIEKAPVAVPVAPAAPTRPLDAPRAAPSRPSTRPASAPAAARKST